ncbi:NAD(P)H-binding protein [Streptomyces albipurpureus]|uniref:NAD(P)H-binding protein n=1 Tax=Streptomyces albipurpureus TaxID=2897419 RepID=A0ABT0UXM8_9ACTN|nr:NAD(P)H-binding protein [Streptomyces sp. CWNU-1]MCM2393334.1 NAD(P)H-binding protein [Streptomyces sp. CWNU-1]
MTTSSPPSVLVTGGTGKTGSRVADVLQRRGIAVRVASRSSRTRFDWSDRTTWSAALSGVRAVYVVGSEDPSEADDLGAFVKTAAEHGVQRLVLLSARVWADIDDGSGHLLATENVVRSSGLEWTILRPTWFAQNFTELPLFTAALAKGELRLPVGEGREPFVDLDDLAEVAAATLTEEGHAGRTYALSGPRALTFGEAIAAIAEASGLDLRYVPVTEEEYLREAVSEGLPADFAAVFAELLGHIRSGESERLSVGVREALNREPSDYAAYVARTDFSSLG